MTDLAIPYDEASAEPGDELEIVGAVAALPALPADDPNTRWGWNSLTVQWLRRKSPHTQRGYWRDLAGWLTWCERTGVNAAAARRADVEDYLAEITERRGLSDATQARLLSALSSWYEYLISNEIATRNPVAAVERPGVERDLSPTISMSQDEMERFLAAATSSRKASTRLRDLALLVMLAEIGLRVNELLAADLNQLVTDNGQRALVRRGKRNKLIKAAVPEDSAYALDAYLAERAAAVGVTVAELSGPIFVTTTGRRLDRPAVHRMIQRVAKAAKIPSWQHLSPHSLRHAFATVSRQHGVPLEDVQDAMHHADPRTTRRYDRDRDRLDKSPAHLLSGLYRKSTRQAMRRIEPTTPESESPDHA